MKIIRNINSENKIPIQSVIGIGNFDGIHIGHQKIFSKINEISIYNNLLKIIIIFEPQPLEFLNKEKAPKRITKFQHKIKYIHKWNFDIVLCVKFNHYFSSLLPEQFINILINKFNIKYIIVGNDFKFGSKRSGNITLLETLGKKYHFNVIKINPIYKNNIKVSSTNIRKYLLRNNFKLANLLLNRPFSIFGKVIHGNKIGRILGYPTANILVRSNIPINNGVYAVKVFNIKNKNFLGICNIGFKKNNIYSIKQKILEVHLFNVNINLYGIKLEVFIYKKIRNEMHFPSLEKLKHKIYEDIKIAKKYFKKNEKSFTRIKKL